MESWQGMQSQVPKVPFVESNENTLESEKEWPMAHNYNERLDRLAVLPQQSCYNYPSEELLRSEEDMAYFVEHRTTVSKLDRDFQGQDIDFGQGISVSLRYGPHDKH